MNLLDITTVSFPEPPEAISDVCHIIYFIPSILSEPHNVHNIFCRNVSYLYLYGIFGESVHSSHLHIPCHLVHSWLLV